MNRSSWDQRIERAAGLAAAYPFASEVLQFYKCIALFQKELYSHGVRTCGNGSGKKIPGLHEEDLDLYLLLPKFAEFLSTVETCAPQPIAECARSLNTQGSEEGWRALLTSFWRTASAFQPASDEPEALLAWIFLQPLAECLAQHNGHNSLAATPAVCPFCLGKPIVGLLRPEGDGAKRSLICAMCATEWAYGRIICPACGEEAVEKLAIYTATQFDYIRVEACDTCRHYIKTVDLSRNGHAVPVVDELATMPLNLWAEQKGYVKLQRNLLGI